MALNVVQRSERHGWEQDEACCDYEGWVFEFTEGDDDQFREPEVITLKYESGVLSSQCGDYCVQLSPKSIDELVTWEVLEAVSGHRCRLPLTECAGCAKVRYLGMDYICCDCRKELI